MNTNETFRQVEPIARQRIARLQTEIRESLGFASRRNPLAAERDDERLIQRLMSKNEMAREEAEATASGLRARTQMKEAPRRGSRRPTARVGPEAIWGSTIDFVGIAFLDLGRRASQAVARVIFNNGQAQGSGFLVSDRLLITNHHVIPSRQAAGGMAVQFDYERDALENPIPDTRFAFDPSIFITDAVEGLDFTLIAIGPRLSGNRQLSSFGRCLLSEASNKHALGEVVNIVQHPAGRYKEVVLRENRLVARDDNALIYTADTEPGSSGSPVFNNQWQPVALHHWGGPYRFQGNAASTPRSVNEGIRISAIVRNLRERLSSLSGAERAALRDALRLWDSTTPPAELISERGRDGRASAGGPRVNSDGSTTWVFPIEITVSAPAAAGASPPQAPPPVAVEVSADSEKAVKPNLDFSDRDGYQPGFIPGHIVPLPRLSAQQEKIAARNLQRQPGDDPFQLRYHHFSSVVNAQRKLPFFTACNIDGRRSKFIDRTSGLISPLDPRNSDHGLMELMSPEGAEASEKWYEDPRLAPGQLAVQDTYDQQVVAGFLDPRSMGRTLRMFQRGHLVRRLDPAWGTNDQARLAEADTFFFTNCSPQVGFFNMGRAAPNTPGAGGGKLWRAVENLVLRNARNDRMRVCSFSGPIFDENKDKKYRTIRIPGRFFKVAVWADDQGLHSLGMIADQRKVIKVWPESIFRADGESLKRRIAGGEAFGDPKELGKVEDFLTTIMKIQHDTGLDFGDAVRDADIRKGEALEARPEAIDDVIQLLEAGNGRTRRSARALHTA